MTDQPQFGIDDCTCIPFTRQTNPPRYLNRPTDTVDMISGWERGRDCPHHAPAVPVSSPPPDQTADRAAVLREAAEHLLTKLYGAVYNDAGQKAADGVNRAVRELLDLADADELRRLAAEAQQEAPGSYARRVNSPLSEAEMDALRERLASGDVPTRTVRRRAGAEAQQPDTDPACTCGDPNATFVPLDGWPDCPQHTPVPPAHKGGNADDCPACQADGLDTIGPPYECPGPETAGEDGRPD